MFDSILVANRGEIALRIMRTAQAMGIQTIAIYVDADKDAPHVRFADKAVLLPDGGYLDIDAVLDAAQKSNAGQHYFFVLHLKLHLYQDILHLEEVLLYQQT